MIRPTSLLPLVATVLLAAVPGRAHAQDAGWEDSGEASWYGAGQAGRRTASGERFDPSAMTAAHTTLPLGSRVRVTVADTGASVVVTVNDRLPPHGVRAIDLSQGAASRLGIVRRGTAWVTLTPAARGDVEEVAQMPDDIAAEAVTPLSANPAPLTPQRRDPPHTRRARRAAAAARPCCRAPSASPARHSAPHRAARRRS